MLRNPIAGEESTRQLTTASKDGFLSGHVDTNLENPPSTSSMAVLPPGL